MDVFSCRRKNFYGLSVCVITTDNWKARMTCSGKHIHTHSNTALIIAVAWTCVLVFCVCVCVCGVCLNVGLLNFRLAHIFGFPFCVHVATSHARHTHVCFADEPYVPESPACGRARVILIALACYRRVTSRMARTTLLRDGTARCRD